MRRVRRWRVWFFGTLGVFSVGIAIGLLLAIWLMLIPFDWWIWLLGGLWVGFAIGVSAAALVLVAFNRRAAARRRAGFDMSPIGRRVGA